MLVVNSGAFVCNPGMQGNILRFHALLTDLFTAEERPIYDLKI